MNHKNSHRALNPATWLLVSDVDDTLTGDDAALRRLVNLTAQQTSLLFALNSSRPYGSISQTIDTEFPEGFTPDAIITAMGTEVRIKGEPAEHWTARFAHWDRSKVDRIMVDLGFDPHPEPMQTPYKASYSVPAGEAQERAREAINKAGIAARIVASGACDFDVLAPEAGKEQATRFVADQFAVDAEHLIVAGDSANDLAMFQAARKGIVVGNARDELRDRVDPKMVYFAKARAAGGVLEGLTHYGAIAGDENTD